MNSYRRFVVSLFLLGCGLTAGASIPSSAFAQLTFQQNSMKKIRVQPGPQASRIGSAVNWQPDFETAAALSKETGKPIFWYVPTLRGSFMDRKLEIDRYMMAGPFSWPDIVAVLNEHYVAVKALPTRQQQQQFNVMPYAFVEPGFVILEPNGQSRMKMDRLTTLHPNWFRSLLTQSIAQPVSPASQPDQLATMWKHFAAGEYEEIQMESPNANSATAVEELLLAGMADFRSGRSVAAKEKWRQASLIQPDHPLAWKAAAEAEGFGPFVRGFEVHRNLPDQAMKAGIQSAGSAAPQGTYDEPELWLRGTEFLLGMQNEDGGFTDCDYDFGGTDSLPNVHVAVTSLVGMALLESLSRFENDTATSKKIQSAIRKAANYVVDEKNLNREDKDEILWAFAYRIRFVSRLARLNPEFKAALPAMVRDLESIQTSAGIWFHEYNNSFVTATALTALKEAEQTGVEVSPEIVSAGLSALAGDRFGNGAYPYDSSRRNNDRQDAGTQLQVAASAGRMPICELGLWVWNRSNDESLASAVQRSLELNEHLMVALKYDDHTSRMAYGGFFFWYDLHGRSEAITNIRDAALRKQFQKQQRELILSLPELDGCFVDSHELGRCYGTAMALLSLAACRED